MRGLRYFKKKSKEEQKKFNFINESTIQDLVNKSENEMMKIRNLGRKSLKEVMDKIKEMGLSFRNDE